VPTGDASLVLAAVDPVIGAASVPAVAAGAILTFSATVRNESQIVDNYDLAVLGLPEGWTMVAPSAAFLVPLGSGRGDSELELRIDIAPPRDYRSTAGIWTFELVATSRTDGTLAARAISHFEVLPFQAWSIEVVPTVNAGRFKARYRTAVRNDGNAVQMLWPAAIDDSGKLRRRFAFGRLTLEAGEVGADTLTVRPRIPKPVGRVTEHRLGVDVLATEPVVEEAELSAKEKLAAKTKAEGKKTTGGVKVGPKGVTGLKPPKLPKFKNPLAKLKLDASTLSRLRSGGDPGAAISGTQIVYRQKPVVPLWVIGLLLVAAVIAILIYLLLPQHSTVPSLVGVSDTFAAEKRLRENGLVLSQPVERRVDPDAEAGEVVEQTPAANTEVDEGSSVSIVVADGSTKAEVPRLKGLTRVKADERLREDGLELGSTEPADAPDNYVVRSQIPDAGLEVDRGTAVRVFLRKPPLTKKQQKAAAAKKKKAAAAAAGAKKDKAATIKIPDFKDKKVAEYTPMLVKLKLKPKVTTVISAADAGTVLATDPKPKTEVKKGRVVSVRASSGPPPLAVETDKRVRVFNSADGMELYSLPAIGGSAAEPSWLPDGEHVVFRAGTRILMAEDGMDAHVQTIYSGPDAFVRPTVAPNGETIALIRREEDDGDLCFGTIGLPDLGRLCLPDDGWNLDGRISWREDGRSVLVAAHRRDNPSVFAVRQYRTTTPFTTDPLKWRGRTATPINVPGKGVREAVYSPSGTRIAAIANLETDRFELVFTAADDLKLVQPVGTKVQACDVAWRSDSQELTVVQADDGCTAPLGKVVHFRRDAPDKTSPVTDKGRNPAYRPVR
jgi:beta-lactam-binding protein with PASTA domain